MTQNTSSNPYESQARQRKVDALVAEIDRWSKKVGIEVRDAARLATLLEDLSTYEWAALAHLADVKPPSSRTIRLVVEAVRARTVRS